MQIYGTALRVYVLEGHVDLDLDHGDDDNDDDADDERSGCADRKAPAAPRR